MRILETGMVIEISPRKTLLVLLSIIGFLVLANIAGIVAKFAFGQQSLFGLIGLFDLHSERNIPTLFSSLQLPKPIGTWFMASGAIYIAGAIGSEMLSARHKALNGSDNVTYACIAFQNIQFSVRE
jgi:hypothetical protein